LAILIGKKDDFLPKHTIHMSSKEEANRNKILSGAWRQTTQGGFFLRVHIQPGARVTEFCDEPYEGALKIKLSAIPEGGKANDALCRLIAKTLGIAKSAVTIERGQTSREKLLFVRESGKE
jgi:uncharacterized protein YggU (UPF0235/DUF167 family)